MKKIFYFLLIMFLGLSCQAAEIFQLELAPSIKVDGKVKTRGNKDTIIMNAEPPSSAVYDALFNNNSSSSSTTTSSSTSTSSTDAIASSRITTNRNLSDPYIVRIDGNNYIMVINNPTNKWDKNNILGIDDTKETLFKSLMELESDGDYTKLTSKELKQANIRFVKVDENGAILVNDKKQDFSLDKIDYIDMSRLRKLANGSVTGIFGHFNVYLKTDNNNKKMIVGYVTIQEDNSEDILFK